MVQRSEDYYRFLREDPEGEKEKFVHVDVKVKRRSKEFLCDAASEGSAASFLRGRYRQKRETE